MVLAAERPADLRQRRWVSSLTRYIATCRGITTSLRLLFSLSCAGLIANLSATAFWMESIVIRRSCFCSRSSGPAAPSEADRASRQRGVGRQLHQRAFQLPHVRFRLLRDESAHIGGKTDAYRSRLSSRGSPFSFRDPAAGYPPSDPIRNASADAPPDQ